MTKLGIQAIMRAAETEGRISPGRIRSLAQSNRKLGSHRLPAVIPGEDDDDAKPVDGFRSTIATAVRIARSRPRLRKGESLVRRVGEAPELLV
jgi:hypothetical protein